MFKIKINKIFFLLLHFTTSKAIINQPENVHNTPSIYELKKDLNLRTGYWEAFKNLSSRFYRSKDRFSNAIKSSSLEQVCDSVKKVHLKNKNSFIKRGINKLKSKMNYADDLYLLIAHELRQNIVCEGQIRDIVTPLCFMGNSDDYEKSYEQILKQMKQYNVIDHGILSIAKFLSNYKYNNEMIKYVDEVLTFNKNKTDAIRKINEIKTEDLRTLLISLITKQPDKLDGSIEHFLSESKVIRLDKKPSRSDLIKMIEGFTTEVLKKVAKEIIYYSSDFSSNF